MTRAEQNVKIAADMYEARRAARFLLGKSYEQSLQPYRDLIARVATDTGLSVVQSALRLGERIPPSDAIPLMCLLAATVEMIESPQHPERREGGEPR